MLAFFAALGLSLALTPLLRDLARRRSLFDGARSVRDVHTASVPRLGGIAFVVSFYAAALAVFALDRSLPMLTLRGFAVLLGGAGAAGLGMVDDLRGLRARYKLAVQFALAATLCGSGFVITQIALPGGVRVHLGALAVPLTMLWIAGMMNAINLIDGLDGLAGGVCAFALAAAGLLAMSAGQPLLALYCLTLLGALIGFLVFNFNPASIFMGDTGSLFLGYFVAVAAVAAAQRAGQPEMTLPLATLVLLAVPLLDTTLALTRRAVRGRPLFSPDRDHLHHRLLARTTHLRAVAILWSACAALAAAAVVIQLGSPNVARAATLVVAVAIVWGLHRLGVLKAGLNRILSDRRRNLMMRDTLARISQRLERAARLDEVLDSLHLLAPALSASRVRVRVGPVIDDRGKNAAGERALSMRFVVANGRQRLGDVEIVWSDGRSAVASDDALAIESLCENAARAVHRISPEAPAMNPTPASGVTRFGSRVA